MNLPIEILLNICEYIVKYDSVSILKLSQTCRQFSILFSQYPYIFLNAAVQKYPSISDCCLHGDVPFLLLFLKGQCNINSCDSLGQAPIHKVCSTGNLKMFNILLQICCDINSTDHNNQSPLLLAAKAKQDRVCTELLLKGAFVNQISRLEHNALFYAVSNQNVSLARMLLCHGVDINHTSNGETCLLLACRNGNTRLVKLLLEYGASAHNSMFRNRTSLLHVACNTGNIDICKLLMEKGCDVNAKDDCGISPIHVAIPYPPILELLLQNGANINDTTNSNVTPLIKACISGNLAVCSLLLSYKPDVFIRNKAGSNALDIANRKGNVKMQKLLM